MQIRPINLQFPRDGDMIEICHFPQSSSQSSRTEETFLTLIFITVAIFKTDSFKGLVNQKEYQY